MTDLFCGMEIHLNKNKIGYFPLIFDVYNDV